MAGPALQPLTTAIFDVDGMLLDTREFMYQGYEHILRAYGYPPVSRQLIARYIGRSQAECYAAFAPGCDPQELIAADDQYRPQILHLIQGYKGLHHMLERLAQAGMKLGIVSGRTESLLPSLENAGIARFFEVIVRGDEVNQGKPHPEGILKALSALASNSTSAAMLGDAVVDIEAGKAAGVARTIGITHGFGKRDELTRTHPTYLIDSLSEIPPLLLT